MRIIIFGLSVIIFTPLVAGDASMIPVSGSKSLALGGYYYAGKDHVTAAFSNPARLLHMVGKGLAVNISDRAGQQQCRQSKLDLHRSFLYNDFSGAAGIYWVPSPKFGLAVLYNRALDYSVRWPLAMSFNEGGTERLYGFQLTSRMRTEAISPIVGVRLGPLSLGLAVNIYNISRQFGFPVGNKEWETNSANPAYQMDIKQQGSSLGWSVGFSVPMSSQLRIGGMVRSGFTQNLSGNARTDLFFDLDSLVSKTAVDGKFQQPLSGGIGIMYKINNQFSVNLDVAMQLWGNSLSNYEFSYKDTAWTARMPAAPRDSITGYYWKNIPLDFKNSFDLAVGVEYTDVNDLQYRCGYRFSSTPNANNSYSLLFPNVNRHWFSVGIGLRYENYRLDLSLAYSVGIATSIKKEDEPYFYGEYDLNTILPSVNVEYQF